jgi:hypothetical protein
VVIDDFDIGWSFRFPFEADSKLVIDPNAELAFAAAAQRFQPVAAKRAQVFEGRSRSRAGSGEFELVLNDWIISRRKQASA